METTEMSTLTQLSAEALDLENRLNDAQGDQEQQEIISGFLEANGQATEEKLDKYAGYIRDMEARHAFRAEESRRLQHLAKSDSDKIDFLKNRLKVFFQTHKLSKVETPHFRVSLVQNSGKQVLQVIMPAEDLPEELQVRQTLCKANTDLIRERLENGEQIPGVVLLPREQSIRIK